MKHLETARDKVLMGPERKARLPDEEANTITAYHEGGHAIVAFYTKESHPLHKVTIMPRGPSLGHTAYTQILVGCDGADDAATLPSLTQQLAQVGIGQAHDLFCALLLVAELAHEVAQDDAHHDLGHCSVLDMSLEIAVLDAKVGQQTESCAKGKTPLEE